jgi:hypothetical protein
LKNLKFSQKRSICKVVAKENTIAKENSFICMKLGNVCRFTFVIPATWEEEIGLGFKTSSSQEVRPSL